MQVTIVVLEVSKDIDKNLQSIKKHILDASYKKSDLLIFPEACITGLINNDIPEHDIKLAFEDSSDEIFQICESAKENNIDIIFGYFEKEGNFIYDTVMYYDHQSDAKFKYRRITPGWFGKNNSIYKCGVDVKKFNTKYGVMSFLICGDLFNNKLVKQVCNLRPEIVIIPIARCFPSGINIKEEWNSIEKHAYIDQMKKLKTNVIMVNCYTGSNDMDYFGGALVINKDGEQIAEIEVLNPKSIEIQI